MTTRGRKPKLIDDGKKPHRSNKELKAREDETPIYESQEFTPPPTLSKKELEVWNWLVGIFKETVNSRVSDADVHLMELYCMAKVAADEAHEKLRKDPRPYILVELGKDKNGFMKTTAKPNPYLKIRTENSQLCLRYFDQLGLSPLARARAGMRAANAKQELNVFKDLMERSDD